MRAFRDAVEAMDMDAAVALMTDDVVFRSPAVHAPYQGKEQVRVILGAVSRVFEDFRYDRVIGAEGAADHALVFRARAGERELEGCDFVHVNADGLVDEFFVMIRPLSGLLALVEGMQVELEKEYAGRPAGPTS